MFIWNWKNRCYTRSIEDIWYLLLKNSLRYYLTLWIKFHVNYESKLKMFVFQTFVEDSLLDVMYNLQNLQKVSDDFVFDISTKVLELISSPVNWTISLPAGKLVWSFFVQFVKLHKPSSYVNVFVSKDCMYDTQSMSMIHICMSQKD